MDNKTLTLISEKVMPKIRCALEPKGYGSYMVVGGFGCGRPATEGVFTIIADNADGTPVYCSIWNQSRIIEALMLTSGGNSFAQVCADIFIRDFTAFEKEIKALCTNPQ